MEQPQTEDEGIRSRWKLGGRTDIYWVLSVCQGFWSYFHIQSWLSDWTTTVSQYLWGIGSRTSAPQMPKSTSAQVPFCVSYHLSITTPEVLHSFCCRWESWPWLREVEQFAQSHTASKVRIEIQNPSLRWHWDSFFLYHITLLPLPWGEWSWHKVELETCL